MKITVNDNIITMANTSNIQTLTWTHIDDYFPFMTENNFARNFCVTFSCLGILLAPASLFTVIWFERFGSDRKRTLLNMLFSLACYECAVFIVLVQVRLT